MAWLTRIGWLLGGKNVEAKIVIVGLSNSGKSTIMHQLKPREVGMSRLAPNIPLVDLYAEKFSYKALTFVAFDLGERNGFANPWEDFYRDCHGIIFVVDSSDRLNMALVKKQLVSMLKNPLLKASKVPMLFLANKMDAPGAVASLQLTHMLGLDDITRRPWHVCSSSGLTGEGLSEALDWLAHQLRNVCTSGPMAGGK